MGVCHPRFDADRDTMSFFHDHGPQVVADPTCLGASDFQTKPHPPSGLVMKSTYPPAKTNVKEETPSFKDRFSHEDHDPLVRYGYF